MHVHITPLIPNGSGSHLCPLNSIRPLTKTTRVRGLSHFREPQSTIRVKPHLHLKIKARVFRVQSCYQHGARLKPLNQCASQETLAYTTSSILAGIPFAIRFDPRLTSPAMLSPSKAYSIQQTTLSGEKTSFVAPEFLRLLTTYHSGAR